MIFIKFAKLWKSLFKQTFVEKLDNKSATLPSGKSAMLPSGLIKEKQKLIWSTSLKGMQLW